MLDCQLLNLERLCLPSPRRAWGSFLVLAFSAPPGKQFCVSRDASLGGNEGGVAFALLGKLLHNRRQQNSQLCFNLALVLFFVF